MKPHHQQNICNHVWRFKIILTKIPIPQCFFSDKRVPSERPMWLGSSGTSTVLILRNKQGNIDFRSFILNIRKVRVMLYLNGTTFNRFNNSSCWKWSIFWESPSNFQTQHLNLSLNLCFLFLSNSTPQLSCPTCPHTTPPPSTGFLIIFT